MRESVSIKNKKGLKLAAVIEVPNKKKKHPFIILLHGFKGYKEEATYTELAKELLKVGIGSIRFDASGFGESEGDLKNDYRFSNYVSDVESVYKYLIKRGFVAIKRIGVMGQSMGGMQAVVFAANHSEIKTVVSISAPNRMAAVGELAGKLANWKKLGYFELSSSKYGDIKVPYAFIQDAMKWDMLRYVKKIRKPILVILGLDDRTVLPEQTKEIFENANVPKKLWEVEGMDHFYKNDPKMLKRINKRIVEFFKKYLL